MKQHEAIWIQMNQNKANLKANEAKWGKWNKIAQNDGNDESPHKLKPSEAKMKQSETT